MKLGICLPHYGRPIEVPRILEVARRAEERGLDSVWVTDHVIVPNQANVIYREHMLDPLAILPWLAGVTRRVALGTSVVILPYRSPIPVAKLLASVDVLSGGRLIIRSEEHTSELQSRELISYAVFCLKKKKKTKRKSTLTTQFNNISID